MSTLYEIDNEILNCIDMDTGEILDEEKLNNLQIERDQKIEGVALWYKNLIADADAYKAEKNKFAEREKSARDKAERLKQFLNDALGGEKFSTVKVAISYRKSSSVQCEDIDKIPKEFTITTISIDKTAIKTAIKAGETVSGCTIVEKQNMQIK